MKKISKNTTILAIESSCDDTSVAIIKDNKILCNLTNTQEIHFQYGGVVPEVASREHLKNIVPLVDAALQSTGVLKSEINAVACTNGPGLLGSLLVGVSFAKALALALKIPLIQVHHMKAHILAHFIEKPYPNYPFLCLTVSGGHTQLVIVNNPRDMVCIGQTRDDAAGEAFDKSGKLLGLGYPAGHKIDQFAQKGKPLFPFPEAQVDAYDFSFSGLKTAIRNFIHTESQKDPQFINKNLNNIAASIQTSIIDALTNKLIKAADDYQISEIAIAGGVSANTGLQSRLKNIAREKNWNIFIPKLEYCTDNAAMIAQAAWYQFQDNDFADLSLSPSARWKI